MGLSRCGVVRFDSDPNQGGWTSVEGEPAKRIGGPGALSNDTLWWSNLSFQQAYESGLNRTPYIKRGTYLSSWNSSGDASGHNEICLDWGLQHRNFTEQQVTEALSAIFSQTIRFAGDRYGLDIRREVPMQDNFADELRVKLLPKRDERMTPEVDAALAAAYQPYSYCVMPRVDQEDYLHVQMSIPAVQYANEVLGSPVPTDQFDFVGPERLPADPEARIAWVMNQDRPALARVRVSDVVPEFAPIIAFGNGAKSGCNRTWASHPELLLLARYARVEIEAVFLFGDYTFLDDRLQLPGFSDLQAMTPTANIVASNHWIGLSRSNPYSLERASSRAWSHRAIWINALDRFLAFSYALQLYSAGISIYRYGAGRVTAIVPKYNYRDAYEVASSIGLLAPPSIAPDVRIQRELRDHG